MSQQNNVPMPLNRNSISLSDWLQWNKSIESSQITKKIQKKHFRLYICLVFSMAIVFLYLIYNDIWVMNISVKKILLSSISNDTFETKLDIKTNIFQQYLHSDIDNTTIFCNSSHFKYIELLLKEIHKYNETFHFKWNSSLISNALASNIRSIPKTKNVRLKWYNKTLYLHKPYGYKGRGWSKTYCTAFISYFYKFTQKYKHSLPEFDIVIYVMDNLSFHYNFVHDYNNIPPIFVSDSYNDAYTNLIFHGLPRSIVKNYYYKMRRFVSKENNNTNPDMFPTQYRVHKDLLFNNKINKVLFRGQMTNPMRDIVTYELNYGNGSSSFVDAKLVNQAWLPVKRKHQIKCIPHNNGSDKCWSLERMEEAAQEKYKYIIVIDGFTTRDAFVLQMPYDSVKLKYKSNLYEFWYYDLKDKENVLFFETAEQLVNIINDLAENKMESVADIATNSANYAKTHFDENSLHCFTLHMINIYNTYFFNESEIELDEEDIKIGLYEHLKFGNRLINWEKLLRTSINLF